MAGGQTCRLLQNRLSNCDFPSIRVKRFGLLLRRRTVALEQSILGFSVSAKVQNRANENLQWALLEKILPLVSEKGYSVHDLSAKKNFVRIPHMNHIYHAA